MNVKDSVVPTPRQIKKICKTAFPFPKFLSIITVITSHLSTGFLKKCLSICGAVSMIITKANTKSAMSSLSSSEEWATTTEGAEKGAVTTTEHKEQHKSHPARLPYITSTAGSGAKMLVTPNRHLNRNKWKGSNGGNKRKTRDMGWRMRWC